MHRKIRALTLNFQLLFVVSLPGLSWIRCSVLTPGSPQCCAHQLIRSMSSWEPNNKNSIFPKINSFLVNTFSGHSFHSQSAQIHPLDVSDTVDTVGSQKPITDLTVPPTPNSRCSTQTNRSEREYKFWPGLSIVFSINTGLTYHFLSKNQF